MALVGGGGAGNVGGGAPAGVGTSINYVGDHCYVYSGIVNTSGQNNDVTLAEFSTASNSYIVGFLNPVSNKIDGTSGDDLIFRLFVNDEQISAFVIDNNATFNLFEEIQLLFAGDSRVKITCRNTSSSTAREVGVIFTGRVYA